MHFTHATASRIKSYKNCEFKYFLEYMLQYPPMKGDNIYSGKGSAVHEALEQWANAKLGKTEKAELDYEKTLREYYADSKLWELDNRRPDKGNPHPVEKSCESCPWATKDNRCEIANMAIPAVEGCPRPNFQEDLDLVEKTLSRKDYAPLALDDDGNFIKKILGVEYPFDMELGGVPVRGLMDLVIEEDEETIEVIDYKTGRSMSYDQAFNDPQVRIYGAVARILFPQYKYVMVTLHYLKNRPVTVPLGPKDDELTVLSLQRAAKQIKENDNPRRQKNFLCNFCVGYDNCGVIRDKFKKNGRFKLPTISCGFIGQGGDCWGSVYPLKEQEVSADTAHKILYACKGHKEIYAGGEYIPKEQSDGGA